jgi:hypothetical protein
LRERPAWLLCGLGLTLSTGLLVANASGNPYLGIATSNVFRLRQTPRQEELSSPVLLPRVTLTGITTILDDKRALLRVNYPARPPEPAKEVSCILTVGQREGPVEVLAIDETTGSITVKNFGTVVVLTLGRDGPPPQAAPPLAPPPLPAR